MRVGAVVAEARFPKAKRFPHELTAARPPRARHHSQECLGSPCILRGGGEKGDARARLPDCLSVRQTVLTPPPSLVSVPDGMYIGADLFRRCLGELHDLLRDDKLQDSIVIILANKQDVPDSLSAPEVNTIF